MAWVFAMSIGIAAIFAVLAEREYKPMAFATGFATAVIGLLAWAIVAGVLP